jgi:hypothetical protein
VFDSFDRLEASLFDTRAEDEDEGLPPPAAGVVFPDPLVPISPIYSGSAPPGAVLQITLFSENGVPLGQQTVRADVGGAWLASFPGVLLSQRPYEVTVALQSSPEIDPGATVNVRTNFAPATADPLFVQSDLTPDNAQREAATQVRELADFLESPVFDPDRTSYAYEYIAAGSMPAAIFD